MIIFGEVWIAIRALFYQGVATSQNLWGGGLKSKNNHLPLLMIWFWLSNPFFFQHNFYSNMYSISIYSPDKNFSWFWAWILFLLFCIYLQWLWVSRKYIITINTWRFEFDWCWCTVTWKHDCFICVLVHVAWLHWN